MSNFQGFVPIFFSNLSQQELSEIAHYSKKKTNKLISELKNNELVKSYKCMKGKYVLTDKAYKVLKLLKETTI